MQRIQFEGATHEFPDDFTDADIATALGGSSPAPPPPDTRSAITRGYEAIAKPVTGAVSGFFDTLTEPLVTGARVAQGEPVSQVFGSPQRTSSVGNNPLAEVVVPQTPLEAGMMLGTGGGGYAARGLRPGLQALSRITGGVVGGTGGDVAEGGSGARGATVGGLGAAAGEGLGALLGRARLAIPGGKRAANEADVERIAAALGKVSPELGDVIRPAGRRATVGTMRGMAEGGGQTALGQAKERAVQGIEGKLAGNAGTFTPTGEIGMPSMAWRKRVGRERATARPAPPEPSPPNAEPPFFPEGAPADIVYSPRPRTAPSGPPATLPEPASGTGRELYGTTSVSWDSPVTIGRNTFSLREANDRLSEIGARAFSKNPLDRTFNGVDQRQLYGRVYREIVEGLQQADPTGAAAAAFERAQSGYSKGLALTRPFQKAGVFDNDSFLNMPKLQRILNDPKQAAALQRKLGPDDFNTLVDAVYRGAGRGDMDRMASGKGGPLDALMQVLRGTNTGFSQSWRVPIAIPFPNLGSRYVGRNPLQLPPIVQMLLDLGAQRAGTRTER